MASESMASAATNPPPADDDACLWGNVVFVARCLEIEILSKEEYLSRQVKCCELTCLACYSLVRGDREEVSWLAKEPPESVAVLAAGSNWQSEESFSRHLMAALWVVQSTRRRVANRASIDSK
jgi:hypothetical protein